ncbi:MAG: hypothetical protein DRO01_02305 [Thermoproteota archaeon]|nr:MAG: hypothetical protein DRO01_02305 [Candidatus Korarchaeota archaeon]
MRRALSPCLALSLVVLLVLPLQLVEAAPSAVEVEIAVDVYIDTYDGELDLSISDPDLNFKRGSDSTLIVGKRKESVEYGRTAFTDDWHEGCGILDAECVGMVGANEYRILLRPSLDGISGLVTSAKIVLTLKQMDPDHDVAILAYPLTANFNEAEATWIYRDSGVGWTNEGGDYDSSSLLDQVVVQAGSPPGTTVEIDVTDYVRSVRQGSSENYGVILVPGATRGWAEFYSTESSNPKGRPKLVVELATVGPPAPPTTVPGTQPPVGGIGPVTPKTWYVTLSPSQASLTQGEAVEIEVWVEALGVNPTVTLSVSGVPPGCSVSFSRQGGTAPFTSTLRIETSPGTPPGVYNVTVRGTSSSGKTDSAPLTLEVLATPSPDFRVVVRPAGGAVEQGGETSFRVVVSPTGGFSQQVSVSLSHLPPGSTCSLGGSPGVPPLEVEVTVTVSNETPPGLYELAVEVSGSGLVRAGRFVLFVLPASAEPAPQPSHGPHPAEGPGGGQDHGGSAGSGGGGRAPPEGSAGDGSAGQRREVASGTEAEPVGTAESGPGGGEDVSWRARSVTLPLVGLTVPLWLAVAAAAGLLAAIVGAVLLSRRGS